MRVILNPAPAQAVGDDVLKNVAILTPNETEAEFLSGVKVEGESGAAEASSRLLERGPEAVLLTLGARGVFVATKTSSELVPAFRVEAVDTTAAGDVFNGALAVALAEDRPLADAVSFANAAGALSATRLGAQPSAPSRAEIDEFLRNRR